MPDLPLLILALSLVAATSVFQGVTGFGYNTLLVPLLALFIDPKIVVPAVILHNVLMDSVLLATTWRSVTLRRIWLLIVAGMVGTPIGVLLLGVVDPEPLRLAIGAVVILSGVTMLIGFQRPLANERLASGVAGSLGGMMNGLLGIAGPPVILLFANQNMAPREFRANIVTFFMAITVFAVASFWLDGALTGDVVTLALVTAPAMGLGLMLGIRLHGRVSMHLFRLVSLVLVILAGSSALVAGALSI